MCTILSTSYGSTIDTRGYTSVSKAELQERLQQISTDMDMRYTAEVHQLIDAFVSKHRNSSEVLLGRSSTYFPIYQNELDKAGLPEELKYLSVVESSLRPTVVSKAGAVGLWQFIKSTGRIYGLTINSTVDERRDAIRSTQAAAAFLKELYAEFGDWSLALAAYNCGPGGVKKAKRRSVADDDAEFWDIKSYLPKETRKYVPKFIAVSYMMNYFHIHGLEPEIKEEASQKYATARVYDYTTFRQLSNQLGIDRTTLWKLNPAFLKGYIPKNSKGYLLTLPENMMYEYLAVNNKWDNLEYRPEHSDNQMYQQYIYGSMKRSLKDLEIVSALPTRHANLLMARTEMPDMPELPTDDSSNDSGSAASQSNGSRYKYVTLQSQQSIQDLANYLNVSLDEIIRINEIDVENPPAPGSLLKVEI